MVNFNARNGNGDRLLLLAGQREYGNISEKLLAKQLITVDTKINNRWTVFTWAAKNGHKSIVELLHCTGEVNVDAKNNEGWMLLEVAKWAEHKDIAGLPRAHLCLV